jgi:peptidase E
MLQLYNLIIKVLSLPVNYKALNLHDFKVVSCSNTAKASIRNEKVSQEQKASKNFTKHGNIILTRKENEAKILID